MIVPSHVQSRILIGCPGPARPVARFWACPVVPLSRYNEGTSATLSQKVPLSRHLGNPTSDRLTYPIAMIHSCGLVIWNYLIISEEGLVNWCEKFWNAMEAVCVKRVEGLFGVAGNLRCPCPLKWVAVTWLALRLFVCWELLLTPPFNRPNMFGWLKLEK